MDWLAPLGYLTASVPGIGGVLKSRPEDFEVEEIPAYEPAGTGTHLFLWVEKRSLPADALVGLISRTLGVARHDIGVAGMKDAHAVTRQYVSVPATAAERVEALNGERVRVLRAALHGNKLRTGHLRGNRFVIRVRSVGPDALAHARNVAAVIEAKGLPNYYGEQRFGRGGDTLQQGLELLGGRSRRMSGGLRRLALSSVQSAFFNRYLTARLGDDVLHRVLPGEVLQVVASGGPFVTDDVAREQTRFEAREVVPAGPILGPKMRAAQDQALARETALLQEAGLDMKQFAAQGKLTLGTRRANLVWLGDLQLHQDETEADALVFKMTLPPGTYATTVMREFMKAAEAPPADSHTGSNDA